MTTKSSKKTALQLEDKYFILDPYNNNNNNNKERFLDTGIERIKKFNI